MAGRSRGQRNAARTADWYSRAAFKASALAATWPKDLPGRCRLIAVGARSLKSFCSGRANYPGKSTELIPGCAKCNASIPVPKLRESELQACSTIVAPLFSARGTLRPHAIQHKPQHNCEHGRLESVFSR